MMQCVQVEVELFAFETDIVTKWSARLLSRANSEAGELELYMYLTCV